MSEFLFIADVAECIAQHSEAALKPRRKFLINIFIFSYFIRRSFRSCKPNANSKFSHSISTYSKLIWHMRFCYKNFNFFCTIELLIACLTNHNQNSSNSSSSLWIYSIGEFKINIIIFMVYTNCCIENISKHTKSIFSSASRNTSFYFINIPFKNDICHECWNNNSFTWWSAATNWWRRQWNCYRICSIRWK